MTVYIISFLIQLMLMEMVI